MIVCLFNKWEQEITNHAFKLLISLHKQHGILTVKKSYPIAMNH